MPVVKHAIPELVRLLKEAKREDGRRWEAISVAADVPWPTIQGWMRDVSNPPLIGVLRVANELNIPYADIARAVIPDVVSGEETLRDLERDQQDSGTSEENSETDSPSAGPESPDDP